LIIKIYINNVFAGQPDNYFIFVYIYPNTKGSESDAGLRFFCKSRYLYLILQRGNDVWFPHYFFELSVSVIIPLWNLDNFNHWDNEQLNAGVLCRIYQSYIPHGRRSGVCYQ